MAYAPAEIEFSIGGTQPAGTSRFNNTSSYIVSNNGAPLEIRLGDHYLSTSTSAGLTTASIYIPPAPNRQSWLNFSISTTPATKFPVIGNTSTFIFQNRGIPFDFLTSGIIAKSNKLAYPQSDSYSLVGKTNSPGFDTMGDTRLTSGVIDFVVINKSTSVYNLAYPITFMCYQINVKLTSSLDFNLQTNVANAPGAGIFATYITVQSSYVSPNATIFSNETLVRKQQQWSN
jgi:hypothetical protein